MRKACKSILRQKANIRNNTSGCGQALTQKKRLELRENGKKSPRHLPPTPTTPERYMQHT